MKKLLKIIVVSVTTLAVIIGVGILTCTIQPFDLKIKGNELKEYCSLHGYNTDYAILVDYGRHSLQKRLFVYDFKQDKVVIKSFAGHGSGGESTILKADFSNSHGSHCSSLGHYEVGRNRMMYNHPSVPAYELIGLDKTNSNALDRGILIHPSVGPLSWGCVTLPIVSYLQLSEFLKVHRKNIILWTYQ